MSGVVIATAPFEVIGAPTAPTVGPESVPVPIPVSVTASLHEPRGSFLDRLRRVLGGPFAPATGARGPQRDAGPADRSALWSLPALGRHANGGAHWTRSPPSTSRWGRRTGSSFPRHPPRPRCVGATSPCPVGPTSRRPVGAVRRLRHRHPLGSRRAGPPGRRGGGHRRGFATVRRWRQDRARRPSDALSEQQVSDPPTLGEHPLLDPDPAEVVS